MSRARSAGPTIRNPPVAGAGGPLDIARAGGPLDAEPSKEIIEKTINRYFPGYKDSLLIGIGCKTKDCSEVTAKGGQGDFRVITINGKQYGLKHSVLNRYRAVLFKKTNEILYSLKNEDFVPKLIYYELKTWGLYQDGFSVMSYINGQTLKDAIVSNILTVEDKHSIFDQLVGGVRIFHRRNIVHHDIKPDNVMLVRLADGTYKVIIIDFDSADYIIENSKINPYHSAVGIFDLGRPTSPHYSAGLNSVNPSLNTQGDAELVENFAKENFTEEKVHPIRDVYSVWRVWRRLYDDKCDFISFIINFFPVQGSQYVNWLFLRAPESLKRATAELAAPELSAEAFYNKVIEDRREIVARAGGSAGGAGGSAGGAGGSAGAAAASAGGAGGRGGSRKTRRRSVKTQKHRSKKVATRRQGKDTKQSKKKGP